MNPAPISADETQRVPPEELPAASAHAANSDRPEISAFDAPDSEEVVSEMAEAPRHDSPPEFPAPPETPVLLPTRRLMYLLACNVFLATLLSLVTTYLMVQAEYLQPADAGSALDAATPEIRQILVAALLTVAAAGALGAVLTNLRGLFQHNRDESGFPIRLEIPFYLRPLTGALTGVFLLLALNLLIVALTAGAATAGWATMSGRMTYTGIALVAGFGAQEGLERLREVLRSVIGQR